MSFSSGLRNGTVFKKLLYPFRRGLEAYNSFLQNQYPKIYELQTAVVSGTKRTLIDGKDYVALLARRVGGQPIEELSYKEVLLSWQFPRDVVKLTPVLAITILPFSTAILIPVAYFFPRLMLTQHFWTKEHLRDFSALNLQKRITVVPELVSQFDRNISRVKRPYHRELLRHVVIQMELQRDIPTELILEMEGIFANSPFRYQNLPSEYARSLCRLNNIWPWTVDRYNKHLRVMDRHLASDTALGSLKDEELREAAMLRCFNPNVENKLLQHGLSRWAAASAVLEDPAESLRLHLPLFISHQHPANAALRHGSV